MSVGRRTDEVSTKIAYAVEAAVDVAYHRLLADGVSDAHISGAIGGKTGIAVRGERVCTVSFTFDDETSAVIIATRWHPPYEHWNEKAN